MKNPDPVRAHLHHLSMRGLSPVTIGTRGHVLARLRASLTCELLDATAADLAAWRATLTGAVTSGTIAGYVSHVRESYAWWQASGYISENPAAQLPIPKTSRRLPRPISEAALMEALDCAPRRVRPWLVLAAWAGLRAKEIALLRGENIQLHAAEPFLLIASDATKGVTERVIPMAPFVISELAAADLPVRGLVFHRFDGKPMHPALISKLCNNHLHDYGVPDTLHSLRHRFGTMTYHVSHDLRAVQELMGHASPATTAGYAAYDRAEAAAAVNGLPVPRLPLTG